MVAPYRMFSLIENCPQSQHEGVSTNRGEMGDATAYVSRWLDANPGRWFIVGEALERKNDFIGVTHTSLRKFGYEAAIVQKKVYARLPDASGLPLEDLIPKYKQHGRPEPFPWLRSDPFAWTLAELRTASSTASEWLRGADVHALAA